MTPLFQKLNYKDQPLIVAINAPDSFRNELEQIAQVAKVVFDLHEIEKTTFCICFATKQEQIDTTILALAPKLDGDAILWFCYPKGGSKKYKCDFNRDTGWQGLGKAGLEGVRMVAIDADWSALRFRKVAYIKTMTRSFAMTQEGKEKAGKS